MEHFRADFTPYLDFHAEKVWKKYIQFFIIRSHQWDSNTSNTRTNWNKILQNEGKILMTSTEYPDLEHNQKILGFEKYMPVD